MRPLFSFARWLRVGAIVATALLASWRFAAADDRCRWTGNGGDYSTEWVEEGRQRGARIFVRDSRWSLHANLGYHATGGAACESCAEGKGLGSILWFGVVANPDMRNIDEMIGPDGIVTRLHFSPFNFQGRFQIKTSPVPITMGVLQGRAQVLTSSGNDGTVIELVSIALKDGCVSFGAVLSMTDGAPIPIEHVSLFTDALAVEFFEPAPNPSVLVPPRPFDDFLLGDARRKAEEGSR